MDLNKKLLEEFKKSESKILAVTKYLDKKDTDIIISYLEDNYDEIIE
jgi:hypothetical protein